VIERCAEQVVYERYSKTLYRTPVIVSKMSSVGEAKNKAKQLRMTHIGGVQLMAGRDASYDEAETSRWHLRCGRELGVAGYGVKCMANKSLGD
jgi:hypothetical protein